MLQVPKWQQWAAGHETTSQVPKVVAGSGLKVLSSQSQAGMAQLPE